MMKYKVLIVDDEPWAAYGLQNLVQWEDYGFEIAGIAFTGKDALKIMRENNPDIIISDIRMPELNGLELIEKIKESNFNALVVFISGYSEFEYAQKALRLGAFDYLLKQVSDAQLSQLLIRLYKHLQAREKNIEEFFYTILLDDNRNITIRQFVQMINKEPAGYYRFVTTDDKVIDNLTKINPDIAAYFTANLGRVKRCGLIAYDYPANDGIFLQALPNRSWRAGISGEMREKDFLLDAYKQSDIAYCTAKMKNTSEPIEYHHPCGLQSFQGYINRLVDSKTDINQADINQVDINQADINQADILNHICGMLSYSLLDEVAQAYNWLNVLINGEEFAHDAKEYHHIAMDYDSLYGLFEELLKINEQANRQIALNPILEYVNAHFLEKMSVCELARIFHFTPNYFTTMFRKSTGVTFTRYLTNKRLEHAKRLLRNSNMPIQEVSYCSGFNDYYQFSKIFKRELDITPKQYRESIPDEPERKGFICTGTAEK